MILNNTARSTWLRDDRFHFNSRESQMFSRAASATTKKPSSLWIKKRSAFFRKKDGRLYGSRALSPCACHSSLGDQGDQYGYKSFATSFR
jgi:hypothetical protein